MENYHIYNDIAKRTNGDIYVGVVGPVRSGKSSFISRFMETLVIPNISGRNKRQIAVDELPQSAVGKTIMTTEPKFVPSEAVSVQFKNKVQAHVRLIDCVGYLVDGAVGHEEDSKPRMVKTPWSDELMPFGKAAEEGTKKVITEHSTVAILVTTDGSITDIPRKSYIAAEERVANELKALGKPFVIVLNCKQPEIPDSVKLADELEKRYGVPVIASNVLELNVEKIGDIMEKLAFEFPLKSLDFDLPKWLRALPPSSKIIQEVLENIRERAEIMNKMSDFTLMETAFDNSERFSAPSGVSVELSNGAVKYNIPVRSNLFYEVLSDECGDSIENEFELMSYVKNLAEAKKHYSKLKQALADVEERGYGVVSPSLEDMKLCEPELVKQGGRYGVKLKAEAPSLHIMKVDVKTEVSPLVGNEAQGEDIVKTLCAEYENDKSAIWNTNMFGKTLSSMISDGITRKLTAMPKNTQGKMRKTVSRIVNEGRGNVICILI